jgi:hypothetical protein
MSRGGLAISLVAVGLAGGIAAAGNPPRVYRNDIMKVRAFEAPADWELAPQSSYPRLLASYSHRDGGKLTLSAQRVSAATTAMELAEQSRVPLEKQGFTQLHIKPEGSRARLEADLDVSRRFARQVYLVEGGIGYVVTLIAPLAVLPKMTADFDEAVKSLQVGGPSEPRDAGIAR